MDSCGVTASDHCSGQRFNKRRVVVHGLSTCVYGDKTKRFKPERDLLFAQTKRFVCLNLSGPSARRRHILKLKKKVATKRNLTLEHTRSQIYSDDWVKKNQKQHLMIETFSSHVRAFPFSRLALDVIFPAYFSSNTSVRHAELRGS